MTNVGFFTVREVQCSGPVYISVSLHNVNRAERMSTVIKDVDVDQTIWTADFRSFSNDSNLQGRIRDVVLKTRDNFKGMGWVVGARRKVALKSDA